MTRDIDLVVEVQLNDIEVIVSVLEPDYYVDRDTISRSITHERTFNIIHREAFIKVDCIVKKRSEYRQIEFAEADQFSRIPSLASQQRGFDDFEALLGA
jgi:hypothetical protein